MSKKKRRKNTKKKVVGILSVVISGIMAIAGTVLKEQISDIMTILLKDGYIGYTDCVPYWKADDYGISSGRYVAQIDNYDYNKGSNLFQRACAIHSYISNPKDSSVLIGKVQTKILSIEANSDPEIAFYGGLRDNILEIYAVNNGWGNSGSCRVDFVLVDAEEKGGLLNGWNFYGKHSIDEICDRVTVLKSFSLGPGEMAKVAEYILNPQKIPVDPIAEYAFYYYLNIGETTIEDYWTFEKDETRPMILSYLPSYGLHLSDYTAIGGDNPDPSYAFEFFAELDVDRDSNLISYIGPDAVRKVDAKSEYLISTVIAPTKSCKMECQNLIVIGGKTKKGKVIDVNIVVPVYDDFSISRLFENAVRYEWTEDTINQSLDGCRYNIRKIYDADAFYIPFEELKELTGPARAWYEFLNSHSFERYLIESEYGDVDEYNISYLEYAVADLNGDDIEELLIQYTEQGPFIHSWLFALDGTTAIMADESFGYRSFRFSKKFNALIGPSDFRPFNGNDYWPFYKLTDSRLVDLFAVGLDVGEYYIWDGSSVQHLTDADGDEYFSDCVDFDWKSMKYGKEAYRYVSSVGTKAENKIPHILMQANSNQHNFQISSDDISEIDTSLHITSPSTHVPVGPYAKNIDPKDNSEFNNRIFIDIPFYSGYIDTTEKSSNSDGFIDTTLYGFSFYVPDGFIYLKPNTLPASGHHYLLYNIDIEMSVYIWEAHQTQLPEPIEYIIDETYKSASESKDVTYLQKGEHWCVVSGTMDSGETIFYSKTILTDVASDSGGTIGEFRISYPAEKQLLCGPIVERIENSFHAS